MHGLITLLVEHPELLAGPESIKGIRILAYEPAFGIIGDPAKRDPQTRQSADHSMVYIVSTLLRKAIDLAAKDGNGCLPTVDEAWKRLMLDPYDYSSVSIFEPRTRGLMEKITFAHGGPEYDERYPDGIPTSLVITTTDGKTFDSGLVMYPAGHARNDTADLQDILAFKFDLLGQLALKDSASIIDRLNAVDELSAEDLRGVWDFKVIERPVLE